MISQENGYLKLLTIGETKVFARWSLIVVGTLLVALASLHDNKVALVWLGFMLLIVVHEAAHAAVAIALRLKIFAIYFSAAGGWCYCELPRTVHGAFLLWAAGLIAQSLLLIGCVFWYHVKGAATSQFGQALFFSFTVINVITMFFNLVPYAKADGVPNDGYVLWKLLRHVLANQPNPVQFVAESAEAPVFSPTTQLLSMKKLVPRGFKFGIEILNDKTTPMEFVVTTLTRHLEMDRERAVTMMFKIHNHGGILIPFSNTEKAHAVVNAISADALKSGHQLICRAVDATTFMADN
jgi:ATP-dependent Clp protease adapter protein ClpS